MAGEGTAAQHPALRQGPLGWPAGVFAGVAIDTHQGRFNMLSEKLESMVAVRDKLAAVDLSTLLRVASVRGKAIHYCCSTPFPSPVLVAPSGGCAGPGRESNRAGS